jgi:hypothetical protein
MKKREFLLFCFVCCIISVNAQTIKLENGISFSKMETNKLNFFTKNFTSYANKIGVEYFEHKNFYISSNIGYTKRGGKDKILIVDTESGEIVSENTISESWNLLNLNTTFRVKYNFENYIFYLGVGPFVDFLIGTNEFSNSSFETYKAKTVLGGVCPELGIDYLLTDKILIGLNASSNYSFTPLVKQSILKLNNEQLNIYFSVGCRL